MGNSKPPAKRKLPTKGKPSAKRTKLPKDWEQWLSNSREFRTDYDKALHVISDMRRDKTLTLTKAGAEHGISARKVTQLLPQALVRNKNRHYRVTKSDTLLRVVRIGSTKGVQEVAIKSSTEASLVGRYSNAVKTYLKTGDSKPLKKFKNRSVKDAAGEPLQLITDPGELKRLSRRGLLPLDSIYSGDANA